MFVFCKRYYQKKMIDINSEYLAIISAILNQNIHCHYKAFAFGSRVKGTSRKHSDLDIVLKNTQLLSQVELAEIKILFMESDIPFRVDLSQWDALSTRFQRCIDEELELISENYVFNNGK